MASILSGGCHFFTRGIQHVKCNQKRLQNSYEVKKGTCKGKYPSI